MNNVRNVTPKKQRKSKQDIAKHLDSLRKVYVGEVFAVKNSELLPSI